MDRDDNRDDNRDDKTAEALAGLTVLSTRGEVLRLGDLWRQEPVALVFVRHYG